MKVMKMNKKPEKLENLNLQDLVKILWLKLRFQRLRSLMPSQRLEAKVRNPEQAREVLQ